MTSLATMARSSVSERTEPQGVSLKLPNTFADVQTLLRICSFGAQVRSRMHDDAAIRVSNVSQYDSLRRALMEELRKAEEEQGRQIFMDGEAVSVSRETRGLARALIESVGGNVIEEDEAGVRRNAWLKHCEAWGKSPASNNGRY